MELAWHTYFSNWIFLWFLIFKSGLVQLSPYPAYLIITPGISVYIIINIIESLTKKQRLKNHKIVVVWIILLIIIDILPFFFLKKEIHINSIIFTIILAGFFYVSLLKQNININTHYSKINFELISRLPSIIFFLKEIVDLNHFQKVSLSLRS